MEVGSGEGVPWEDLEGGNHLQVLLVLVLTVLLLVLPLVLPPACTSKGNDDERILEKALIHEMFAACIKNSDVEQQGRKAHGRSSMSVHVLSQTPYKHSSVIRRSHCVVKSLECLLYGLTRHSRGRRRRHLCPLDTVLTRSCLPCLLACLLRLFCGIMPSYRIVS